MNGLSLALPYRPKHAHRVKPSFPVSEADSPDPNLSSSFILSSITVVFDVLLCHFDCCFAFGDFCKIQFDPDNYEGI